MSNADPKTALDHLNEIADGGDTGDALESIQSADAAEAIMPTTKIPDEQKPLVERTAAKIANQDPLDEDEGFALEAIIIPDKRPVLNVTEGNEFSTDHALWVHLNSGPKNQTIKEAIPPVGRVELPTHPSLPYGGTGFIVGPGLLMTNRHVAEIFGSGLGLRDLVFRPGATAAVDLEKRVDGGEKILTVEKILMIHPYWDMALLKVEGIPSSITPLKLANDPVEGKPEVVAIGYPAFDPRNNKAVQDEVFKGVYNVKRIMPGKLTGAQEVRSFGKRVMASTHDGSTLGGASGSAMVELTNGHVVALHFGGRYLKSNYGVPSHALARDGRVIDSGVQFAETPQREAGPWDAFWSDTESVSTASPATGSSQVSNVQTPASVSDHNKMSVTIPVKVTIDIGALQQNGVQPAQSGSSNVMPALGGGDDNIDSTEAPVESYLDRKGYEPDFLGVDVPMPKVVDAQDDVLEFEFDGKTQHELRYEHFSVVMSESRRQCFQSAVNIDGATSRRSKRVGWRLDSRIPKSQQIIKECYGSPPKFSRGHMTRREDPAWGDVDTANRGNKDSMHVTNAVPQMQSFNSPIWLALEDHALDHAREDDMKISVFTGPYFHDDDPVIDGVKIPVAFWKIIAFIHDETGELCATGYEMDQIDQLPSADTEFVFGDFKSPQLGVTVQTSIRKIEQRSGISFGNLVDVDPLSSATESFGGRMKYRLDQMDQIDFLGR